MRYPQWRSKGSEMNHNIAVSKNGDCFMKEGKPFFYLADTVWCAFTNPAEDEWEQYLDYRRQQGFNALQINILPQWDRSRSKRDAESRFGLEPFELNDDGCWDFAAPQEDYFQRARKMVGMAQDRGFLPALVLLWCDFVAGTWGSRKFPDHVMPVDAVVPYVDYVTRLFSPCHPVYLVSGDTDLSSRVSIEIYLSAMETVKKNSPHCLTTLHLNPAAHLPDAIADSPYLDFYMYQSGHQAKNRNLTFELADRYCSMTVKRPVVNGEPCYEGHGIVGGEGRHSAFDVRRAIWQSLLSGAKAGVTYGAHGVWPWHRRESHFPSKAHSDIPFLWREAMHFRGAQDAAFAKWAFEDYGLFDLQPSKQLIDDDENIRVAVSPDANKIAFYAPRMVEVELAFDLRDYECLLWNLEERIATKPVITAGRGKSAVRTRKSGSDVLFLALR
jgi:hypothetical protein